MPCGRWHHCLCWTLASPLWRSHWPQLAEGDGRGILSAGRPGSPTGQGHSVLPGTIARHGGCWLSPSRMTPGHGAQGQGTCVPPRLGLGPRPLSWTRIAGSPAPTMCWCLPGVLQWAPVSLSQMLGPGPRGLCPEWVPCCHSPLPLWLWICWSDVCGFLSLWAPQGPSIASPGPAKATTGRTQGLVVCSRRGYSGAWPTSGHGNAQMTTGPTFFL